MDSSNIIILVVGLLVAWSVYSSISKHLRRARVAKKLSSNPLIIDVRSPGEFSNGHYQGAINIPLQKLEQSLKRVGAKGRPVLVYCATGTRSGRAKSILKAHGYSDVTNGGSLTNMP